MKFAAECLSRVRFWHFGDFFRGAHSDDVSTVTAALGSQIDEIISRLNHFEVVFHDDDGVATINEAMQDGEQLVDIVKVQPGCRFIKEVERLASAPFGEFA